MRTNDNYNERTVESNVSSQSSKKGTFAAKTRSRDLGYRRFLWMMENLLYNGWVMLNTAVADQSPDRDDDEIVVKQATYLDELDRRVLSGLSLDLEFPDVEFG